MDHLRTCLLDLLYELRERTIPLTIGGGFGLFLKRRHFAERRVRTVFAELPEPRATNVQEGGRVTFLGQSDRAVDRPSCTGRSGTPP
jgi:hypothetical protein